MRTSLNLNSKRILTSVEAAYVAGFWDGEGTISIWKEIRKANKCGR